MARQFDDYYYKYNKIPVKNSKKKRLKYTSKTKSKENSGVIIVKEDSDENISTNSDNKKCQQANI